MISNIGFGENSGRTIDNNHSNAVNLTTHEINIFNIKYPIQVVRNKEADEYTYEKYFLIKTFIKRAINKLFRMLKP